MYSFGDSVKLCLRTSTHVGCSIVHIRDNSYPVLKVEGRGRPGQRDVVLAAAKLRSAVGLAASPAAQGQSSAFFKKSDCIKIFSPMVMLFSQIRFESRKS